MKTRKLLKAKAEQTFQDTNGVEIYFKDLENGESPEVGDKATIEGKPADGSYNLPDGTILTIADGEVTEVKQARILIRKF